MVPRGQTLPEKFAGNTAIAKRLSMVVREPSTLSIYDLCVVASLPWDDQPARVFD